MKTVRYTGATIQLHAVVDDGDTLDPLTTQPISVPARNLAHIDFEALRTQLQAEVDQQEADVAAANGAHHDR